jgi:hypothetical protein
MKIYYKRIIPSYVFRPLIWPSSGRCVTTNKYTEVLQNVVNQGTCRILNIKIAWFKIRITVENTDTTLILVCKKLCI